MPGRCFDADVLLYVVSDDAAKADRAEEVIVGGGTISVQVLNELTNVAHRKMRLSWVGTHALLSTIRGLLTVHPITLEIHRTGLELTEGYSLSVYDAMVAASALHADCDTLWSEGIRDGMVIEDRLLIADPFRSVSG